MANHGYPRFPRGLFNQFSKDLRVVDYYIKAFEAEKNLKEAIAEYDAAEDQYSRCDAKMVDVLLGRLATLTSPAVALPDTPDTKAVVVQNAVERIKHATRNNVDPHSVVRSVADVALSVLPYFCTFDPAGLAAVTKPIVAACADLKAARSRASGVKGDRVKKYNAAISEWSGIFAADDHMELTSPERQAQEAYEEAKRFVDTWRSRARMFLSPVTVEGTSIQSLPDSSRLKWSTAYNKLRFNELKRSDVYVPFKYRSNENE